MTQPTASDPPDTQSIAPRMTPEYRTFLAGIKRRYIEPEDVAMMFFALCDGTPEERGRAHELAACLLDPGADRGFMDGVWSLARGWMNAAQGRYEASDLVSSTAEEIVRALGRPSSRKVATTNWLQFCDQCFQRARQQAGMNGDNGYKSISARAVRDAQRLLTPHEQALDDEALLDNVVLENGVVLEDATSADEQAGPDDEASVSNSDAESSEDEVEARSILQEDGHDRHTVATDMAYALRKLSPDTDNATAEWLLAFIDDYLDSYVATIEEPNRRAVAEAVLKEIPTAREAKFDCVPLAESLDLTRDQINALKKEERIRFKGALVRAVKTSAVVHDDFLRSVLERSPSGIAPWSSSTLPSAEQAAMRSSHTENPTDR